NAGNNCKNQDQGFRPDRTLCGMKPQQSMKVKRPWVNVWGIAGSATGPSLVSTQRIQRAVGIAEERGEKDNCHQQPHASSCGQMPNFKCRCFLRRAGGINVTIPGLVEHDGYSGCREANDESFLGGLHQAQSSPGEHYPTQLACSPIAPAGTKRQESEED